VFVVASHVANETKESMCCPSMPKGPTLKRHITTIDKLEDVGGIMQLHSRTITYFSQLLLDSVKLCNKLVVLSMSLIQHDLHSVMDVVVARTFQNEAVCINPCKHWLQDGKHGSLVTNLEGHTAISWFSKQQHDIFSKTVKVEGAIRNAYTR
jgi:hypothetical protein